MRKIIFLIVAIMLQAATMQAQKYSKAFINKYNAGSDLVEMGNYADALPIFAELQEKDPTNANLCYYHGLCLLMTSKDINKVIPLLITASQNTSSMYKNEYKSTKAPLFAYYHLALALHRNCQVADARKNYQLFRAAVKDKNWQKQADKCLAQCDVTEKMMLNPLDLKVENLGPAINTQYPEYSPVMSFDKKTLIFTSRRPYTPEGMNDNSGKKKKKKTKDEELGGKDKYGKYFEDLYIATRDCDTCAWGNVKRMGNMINTPRHDASIGMSLDGKQLLIYRDDNGNGNIYLSKYENGEWGKPVKFNKNINTKSWETHACFTPDGNTMYYTSNKKKGGQGERDIYMTKKSSNGKWGNPVNIGSEINTASDEDSPFILPDGQTMYFASNGHETMGGFDIFKTKMVDGKWTTPENVGYPINTPGNDVFYFPADETHAYYSSEKTSGFGDQDIYMITIKGRKEVIAEYKLLVVDSATNQPLVATAELSDSANRVLSTYTTSSDSGLVRVTIPFERNLSLKVWAPQYKTWFENVYIERKVENINGTKNVYLVKLPMPVDNTVIKNAALTTLKFNIVFFDYDLNVLRPVSNSELQKVTSFLAKYPNCNIEISGHTCTMGSHEYNQRLSESRAKSVYDYMVSQGIDSKRLSYKGFSFDQPLVSNENEDDRMKNRRTEFRIMCSNLPDSINLEIAKNYPADAGFRASPNKGSVHSAISGYTSSSDNTSSFSFAGVDVNDYTVQIGAGRLMRLSYFTSKTSNVNVVKCNDGLKRFFTGSFATEAEAKAYRDQVAGKGFSDAFVRPFSELISLTK